MHVYFKKRINRWKFGFRRDPDAGRVLFIGPWTISLDVN